MKAFLAFCGAAIGGVLLAVLAAPFWAVCLFVLAYTAIAVPLVILGGHQ